MRLLVKLCLAFAIPCTVITENKTTRADKTFDYCSISDDHTMCKYKTMSENCIQYRMQDKSITKMILEDHNRARSKYASGHSRFFVPNMLKMYWDPELADISSRWACQCKRTLDDNRDTRRFPAAQIVWTEQHDTEFVQWESMWANILRKGGSGFFRRNNWGRMISNYDPSSPLSFIYNPYIKYVGCTLSNYLAWSVDESRLALTTNLVCNYGPAKPSYPKVATEDWPCRTCPPRHPCYAAYYIRRNEIPYKLADERNLCIDPKLERYEPLPGKVCSDFHQPDSIGKVMSERPRELGTTEMEESTEGVPQKETKDLEDFGDEEYEGEQLYVQPFQANSQAVDYCRFDCKEARDHTMCKYNQSSPKCENFLSFTNKRYNNDILHFHNDFRNKYAQNEAQINVGAHYLVSNMLEMIWSEELEEIATRWISQCQLKHDDCRDAIFPSPRYGRKLPLKVGQNIAFKRFVSKTDPVPSHKELFDYWVAEGENFHAEQIDDYLIYSQEKYTNVSNFVQLIWATSYYLGCAHAVFKESGQEVAMLVCNYAPQGLNIGHPIFIPGGPCTGCDTDTDFPRSYCRTTYPNLCISAGDSRPQSRALLMVLITACRILNLFHGESLREF